MGGGRVGSRGQGGWEWGDWGGGGGHVSCLKWGGGQYGTEPVWYRPIMVQKSYLAMLNYIF